MIRVDLVSPDGIYSATAMEHAGPWYIPLEHSSSASAGSSQRLNRDPRDASGTPALTALRS